MGADGKPCCSACGEAAKRRFEHVKARMRAGQDIAIDVTRGGQSNADRGETLGGAGGAAVGEAYAGPGGAVVGSWLGKKGGRAYGGLFDSKNNDCKPGEDPSDPECDGSQVVTGARICGPGESPSSGCIPDQGASDGSARRGPPKTSAFPSQAAATAEKEQEAQRTRAAQAQFEAEGLTDKERDARDMLKRSTPGAGYALTGAGIVAGLGTLGVWLATKKGWL